MPFFTYNEYVDMLLIFGESRKNGRQAHMLYRERFPDRTLPSKNTFIYVERNLRHGFFPNGKHQNPRRKTAQTDENIINILAYLQVYPHTSLRFIASELGTTKSTVQRVVKNHKFHPFKIHLVQGLTPQDPEHRLHFIAELEIKIADDPLFLNNILWSDESRFHNNGTVNRHNSHYWSQENPKWVREGHFQQMWGINVWCGLFNGGLIGPYFYQDTLTGERYLHFLQNDLPELLDEIPLNELSLMWWQQDGAPPHFHGEVRRYINEIFPERWIGRNGTIHWPARSPDMSPLDFFLWGYLKGMVYTTPPVDVLDLQNRIRVACQTVTPAMINAACTRNLKKRFAFCINSGGSQFEHLLK